MDENYHADNTYYEVGDIIKIDNVSMANNFPIIAFYDSNKTYLSKINSIPSININITSSDYPENAVYCRLAYYGVNQPTIDLGYSTNFYELENTDESLQSQIDTLSSQIDNTLINYLSEGSSLFTNGHYINYTNGTEVSNSSYSCTDYLEIPKIKQITLINCQTGNGYMAAIAFYDSNKTFISSLRSLTPTQVGTYTVEPEQVPDNTKYIRVSGGIVNTYNPKVDYTLYIKETVEQHNEDITGLSNTDISLSDRITVLENAEETVKTIKFKCFQGNSTLAPNEVLTLPSNKVRVNSLLSVSIDGTIEQVDLGVGYTSGTSHRTYEAKWIELTQTEVKVYGYYNNGNVLEHTYSHGLTLTDNTRINIHTTLVGNNDNSTTTIRISTNDGQEWNQENTWGQGIAFVQNMNTSGNLNVELKFMPRDIDKNIWVFGDSYFSTWPKYLYRLGFSKWLRNSQPGSSPEAAYSELQHLLTLGYKPSYVVWCLGMNGATTESMVDGHYVINNNQKIYIDNVKSLCESYDIVPVFTCIPTVPTRQKTGFRTYIQNLNVRYIDMYKAVGSDEYGIWHGKPTLRGWTSGNDTVYTQIMGDGHAFVAVNDKVFDANGNYTNYQVSAIGESNSSITVNNVVYNRDSTKDISGLLSNDGVHPTELGAKVIANSVMAEFPEISICE
jgi:lysophospholipase L1-like esterase